VEERVEAFSEPPRPGLAARLLKAAQGAVLELLGALVPALLIVLLLNGFVAQAALVEEGPSMQPNLYQGYRVMTEKLSYRFHLPRRGDVVIVSRPNGEKALVKRVIGRAWIDGEPLAEPWVTYSGGPDYPPTRIPDGCVFILGDNRPASRDSRMIGPVPIASIRGHVLFTYWPPRHVGPVP
jgi:signal peptidase I